MLFLIEYNREKGKIVTIRKFDESEKTEAEIARLELELDLRQIGVKHEVVILDAINEARVRRTHRRYFESLEELAKAS
jgi:hypothetical protein